MKNNKFKKILVTSLVATTSAASAIGLSTSLLLNSQQQNNTTIVKGDNNQNLPNNDVSTSNPSNNDVSTSNPSIGTNGNTTVEQSRPVNTIVNKNNYSMRLKSFSTFAENDNDAASKSYHLTIENNIQPEGVIQFVTFNENNEFVGYSNDVMFKPSETIYVGIQLNEGYEDYTAREIKIYAGENQSIYLTAQRVSNWNLKNLFEIKMPSYEETVNKKTGKSWLYNEGTLVNVAATFIKESIGTNGNDVNWDQGAMNNSMAGYVYELTGDTTWTNATQKIYEAFENKDINRPIDIYFFLNGYTLTFDVEYIDLDIKSGWALHFYNNKIDRRNPTTGKYGEIRIANDDKKPKLKIDGAIVFGSSVKFKYMIGSEFIWFENFENKNAVGGQENDPEVRLAGVDPKPQPQQ